MMRSTPEPDANGERDRPRPRVLHLLEKVDRGGTEILILDLARVAPGAGIDMEIYANGSGTLAPEFAALGPRFHVARRHAPIDPWLVFRLRSIVRHRRIDVVHAHQAVTGLHAWLATRGTHTASFLSFHGHVPGARKDAAALSFLLPRVDRRIAVSRGFLERLRRQLPAARDVEFDIVYNGIDVRRLSVPAHDLRAELGLAPSTLLLGMVGNFQAAKDQATICRALPRVFGRFPDAAFVFVGAASHPASHRACVRICEEQGIGSQVFFLGSRPDVPALLPALDLFVFSSLEDSFGIAMLEAMLAGVPCLASDIPSLVEVSGNGTAADHFRTGDSEDLAEKTVRLLEDAPRRRRLAEVGGTWVRERFTMEHHARALADLYRATRDRRNTPRRRS